MILQKAPLILKTDLFDLDTFGCFPQKHPSADPNLAMQTQSAAKNTKMIAGQILNTRLSLNFGKLWMRHPEIDVGIPLFKARVVIRDEGTGEVKLDAVLFNYFNFECLSVSVICHLKKYKINPDGNQNQNQNRSTISKAKRISRSTRRRTFSSQKSPSSSQTGALDLRTGRRIHTRWRL